MVKVESQPNTEGATLLLKVKSNDGELYEVKVFRPKAEGAKPTVISAKPLYVDIPIEKYHQEKIEKYLAMINETYKTDNTGYEIKSVQQQIDDDANHVYRVVGKEDGKHYKIKI